MPKVKIHPKVNTQTKVTCTCGATFLTTSTLDEIHVEVCSNCHPFYTGEDKIVDTEGRVDRFERKRETARKAQEVKKQKQEKKQKEYSQRTSEKPSLKDLLKQAQQGKR